MDIVNVRKSAGFTLRIYMKYKKRLYETVIVSNKFAF